MKKVIPQVHPDEVYQDILKKAIEFSGHDTKAKEFAKKADKLKKDLKTFLEGNPDRAITTDKGHVVLTLEKDSFNVQLQLTARVTTSLVPEAVNIIQNKLPKRKGSLLEEVTVIRQDRLQELILEDKIPAEIVDSLYVENTNYSFTSKITSK